jgi:hypothetical protein
VTICPCCGFEFEGDLRQGCAACGARAVGDPLPRPAHILPAYGRPLLLVVIGTLMVLSFIVEMIFAVVKQPLAAVSRLEESWIIPVDLWSLLIAALVAAERAAWHLKWVLIPVSLVVLWSSSRIYKSMLRAPSRFVGLRAARRGLMASALVCLLVATLIGVTVPRRLREHQMAIDAGLHARAYTIDRALLEYRRRNGTLPTELKDLLKPDRLPDPDGSIAAALENVGQTDYKPTATLAELPKDKPRTLAGAVIRKTFANAGGEDAPDAVMSFTDYELRLPGEDGILNTDDDLIVRDGVIMKASEVEKPTSLTAAPLRKP